MMIRPYITCKPVSLGCRNVQVIVISVFHSQVFTNHSIQLPECQAQVTANAVVYMHDPVIFLEIGIVDLRRQYTLYWPAPRLDPAPTKDLPIREKVNGFSFYRFKYPASIYASFNIGGGSWQLGAFIPDFLQSGRLTGDDDHLITNSDQFSQMAGKGFQLPAKTLIGRELGA